MKKQSFILLALCAVILLFLSACDKTNSGDPDTFLVSISDDVLNEGSKIVYNTSKTEFTLSYAPTLQKKAAPAAGRDFWVAETEITYGLWKEISDWAVENDYILAQFAQPGSDVSFSSSHPVTRVCWYDAVVWCNALTEYFNNHNGDRTDYSYAYLVGGEPIRNAEIKNTDFEIMRVNTSATGFRIPTNDEWYIAASWGGVPDNYASGASGAFGDEISTGAVAWYRKNSDMKTHPVAGKQANNLGLYDMSGNVSEIVFDLLDMYYGKSNIRGGAWNSNPEEVSVTASHPTEEHTSSYSVGFRIVRTPGDEPSAK